MALPFAAHHAHSTCPLAFLMTLMGKKEIIRGTRPHRAAVPSTSVGGVGWNIPLMR